MAKWTTSDIPPQNGRTAVVTGTGGLGFEVALALALTGGDVIVAGRDPEKGAAAIAAIKKVYSRASVSFEAVDLADLASVADFGSRLVSKQKAIDLLVNNAGVMTPPRREVTRDGLELQFGVNYLAHFALTNHLLPLLRRSRVPRVVTLSSVAARQGSIDFDDLQHEKSYRPMRAYSQSKLACLMFAFELQRRSDAADWGITSIAAHPGVSRTQLLHNAPGRYSMHSLMRSALWFLFQPAAQGALPTLFAATSPEARASAYYGPSGMGEIRGYPTEAKTPPAALDVDVAARLWDVSEELVGFRFGEALPPAQHSFG